MKVAVVGGTGTVGRHVVAQLAADGHEAMVVTRSRGVDICSGVGLNGALAGAQALIDVSGQIRMRSSSAIAFGQTVTKNLLAEAQRAGVQHYVAISIVGIDRVPYPYYKGKLAQEETLLRSGFPATIARVTQFHELPEQFLSRMPLLAPMPTMPCRPIAAATAGHQLAKIVTGEPLGFAPELAGPQQESFADMAQRILHADRLHGRPTGKFRTDKFRTHKHVVPFVPRGRTGRAVLAGGLLPQTRPGEALIVAGPTFEEWLADRYRPGSIRRLAQA